MASQVGSGRTATTDNTTDSTTATATTDTWDRFKFFDRLRICDKFLIWIYLIYLIYLLLPRSCVHGPAPSRRSCLQRTCRRCSWSSWRRTSPLCYLRRTYGAPTAEVWSQLIGGHRTCRWIPPRMERAAAIEATSAPPNKRTLTGGTKRIQKIECIVCQIKPWSGFWSLLLSLCPLLVLQHCTAGKQHDMPRPRLGGYYKRQKSKN